MNQAWKLIYAIGGAGFLVSGYTSLDPASTAGTNSDWVFVTLSFVSSCVFPLVAMAYSRRKGVETFRRPSLDRHPINWWGDPLQSLRVSSIGIGLFVVGACFALPKADHRGVMMFWFYAAVALGLFIGERMAYRIYAKRII